MNPNPICKCGKNAEPYNNDSEAKEKIWICTNGCGAVVQRNNIKCPNCKIETIINKFNANCVERSWTCSECNKVFRRVSVKQSEHIKEFNKKHTHIHRNKNKPRMLKQI